MNLYWAYIPYLYEIKKQTKKNQKMVRTLKSLMPADPKLAKQNGQSQVLSTMATVPELAKKIEAVG